MYHSFRLQAPRILRLLNSQIPAFEYTLEQRTFQGDSSSWGYESISLGSHSLNQQIRWEAKYSVNSIACHCLFGNGILSIILLCIWRLRFFCDVHREWRTQDAYGN